MEEWIKVTDKEKFEKTIKEIDATNLKVSNTDEFEGGIYITLNNGQIIPNYGLIKVDEFEKEFGFVLEATEKHSSFITTLSPMSTKMQ